ncbi:MAG: FKBP-type peptidyl-prolyl cis-trans isomerase [Thermoplasmata archaeon]|nr:FKBP-type peptidyl-prolyl cis-trans isomerase [Thermoplasmata archaeon]
MEKGSIVWIEYEVKVDDEVVETTSAEQAAELGLEARSGPMPVLVGSDLLLPGLMEAIEKAGIGEEQQVEVPPEKGHGERDPKLIELFPIPKLRRMGVDVEDGGPINVKGREGRIIRLSGSRAWVDFNHPKAGETLKYRFTVVKASETPEDIVRGLIDIFYRMSASFDVTVEGDECRITVPATAKFDGQWQFGKLAVTREVLERLGVAKVLVIEEYERHEHDHGEETADATEAGEGGEGDAKGEVPSEGDGE